MCKGESDHRLVEEASRKGEPDQRLVEEAPREGGTDQRLVEEASREGEPDQRLVEEAPREGGTDQRLVEEAPHEGGTDQRLVERCFACGVLHHALGCLRHLGSHSSREKAKVCIAPVHTQIYILPASFGKQWCETLPSLLCPSLQDATASSSYIFQPRFVYEWTTSLAH